MASDKQIRKQRQIQAQQLRPVVIVGNKGLTDEVQNEINLNLEAHELIKIRLNASDKHARQNMINTICDQQKAELIQAVGHVIVIYRKSDK